MPITTIVLSNLNGAEVAEGSGLATFSACWAALLHRRSPPDLVASGSFPPCQPDGKRLRLQSRAVDYINKMGGATQQHMALIDKSIEQQAYMMSTIDYFWLLGWALWR